ncbi:hypothetical protein SBADM41S_09799 [Streptomyces badius]
MSRSRSRLRSPATFRAAHGGGTARLRAVSRSDRKRQSPSPRAGTLRNVRPSAWTVSARPGVPVSLPDSWMSSAMLSGRAGGGVAGRGSGWTRTAWSLPGLKRSSGSPAAPS